MDPLTHGLTGALLGKALFAEPYEAAPAGGRSAARLAVLSATLGAIFPDIDIISELVTHNELSVIEYHRGITHSFVCLPLWAALLAAITWFYARRHSRAAPTWAALAGIYAVGLASHILLDLITSFGTMIWSPLSYARVSWDLVVIIDFAMTAIVLLPQAAAWVYRKRERSRRRAIELCLLFTGCAVLVERLARAVGFPFTRWAIAVASLLFAALFFLPARHGWGFRVRRANWCRAGLVALAGYLGLCGVAHQVALHRVEQFARNHTLRVDRMGALPLPPSITRWNGLIRTPDGVYLARLDLLASSRGENPGRFVFFADSPPNGAIEQALRLPRVKTYLWFARFPVYRFSGHGSQNVVEISDLRFATRRGPRPAPFTFRVTFDAAGRAVEQTWAEPEP